MNNHRFHWMLVFGLAWMAAAGQTAGQVALDQYAYRAGDFDALRSGFAQPPREAGPWVHWFWFDGMLSEAEISREIHELADAGFAGAEIRCITFHGWSGDPLPQTDAQRLAQIGHRRVEYLSDEFIDLLAHACAEAKRRGMRLSINMGQGWPPGGPWITEEHRTKLLTTRSFVVNSPETFVQSDLPQRATVLAWKLDNDHASVVPDSFVDLAEQIETVDGRPTLRWEAPPGNWLVGLFNVVPGGIADKGAYETEFFVAPELVGGGLRWTLDLGRVYEVARIWVNGKQAGSAWSPPYHLDVTEALHPGRNQLRVVVANLLKNRLEPSSSYHRPSGLLGPVRLRPNDDGRMGD